MDYSLPVAKRTRSRREAQLFREYNENIKKKKLTIGGSESVSESKSTFKADDSVQVGVDCRVDSAVRDVGEEESAIVGGKDKGKSVAAEGKDNALNAMPIMLDGSDDDNDDDDDDDVVYRGEKNDMSAEGEDVICLDDEDVLGESSSFYSNNVDANVGLNRGVAIHECSSDDDDNDDDLEEYSDELKVFSSEEDNDDPDDEDYSSSEEEEEDMSSSCEEEEVENYVGDSCGMKRGSDEGKKLKRVQILSSSSEDEECGEEDDQIEVAGSMCDDKGEKRRDGEELNWRIFDELDALVDSDNTKDNELNKNSSVSVGQKFHCVAKRTRSHFVPECRKKKTELGTSNNPCIIDLKDRDTSSGLGDNDDDNGFDDETYHKVCKTGSGSKSVGRRWQTVSKQNKGNFGKSKRKQNSMMKDQDVEDILLNSILEGEEIPLEDSLFSKSEVLIKERSESDDDKTSLPVKFNFGNEEPTPPEKSECEKDMDSLWKEMDFAFAASALGSTESSMQDKNEVEPVPEIECDQATCCAQGKHQLILDEEIGIICKFCSFVQLEIRYIVPPFAQNPWERCRKGSKFEDDSVVGDLHFQDSDLDSQSGLKFCSQTEGTVWDLVPGVRNSMYPHQREGFEFIWRNIAGSIDLAKLKQSTISDCGNGCIISHAPGTGKTRLAIVFLQAYMKMYPTCKPVIVAPCNMLLTWEEEFRKWKTGIRFVNMNNQVLNGEELLELPSASESLIRTVKLLSWKRGGSVLGISYTRFKILVGGIKNGEKKSGKVDVQTRKILLELPGLFVFDEGHIPRHEQTGIFRALSEIQTEKRIILSGTPFQNNFEELFNTFYLVRPKFADGMRSRNIRGSVIRPGRKRNEEKGKWTSLTSSIGKVAEDRPADERKLNELRTIIAPFVHVHKGTVLQDSLPGLRQSVVVLRPFDLQKQLIDGVQGKTDMIKQNNFVSLISAHPSLLLELPYEKEKFIVNRAQLERLRLNPEAGTKMKFLMELLRLSSALNEKVLVFSFFLKPLRLMVDQIQEVFNWTEWSEVLYMDGKQDVKQRQSSIDIFNDPSSKVKVLLASKEACCEGINLVGASRVVLLDLHWNPSVDRQAISRAYRLGQKKFVHVYCLITSGTMEEKKCSGQARKDWLSKSVFFSSDKEGNDGKVSSYATEDKILEEMLQHDKVKYIENIEEYDESKLMLFGDR